MGVSGLEAIGFQSNLVLINGSFTDADGVGPYTASVQWTTGGPFTPLILNNGSKFVAGWIYATAGTRTVTVRVCDAAGACGTDTVSVQTSVTQKVTPTRCVVDRGASVNPRYEARFGYTNPAAVAIYVPVVAPLDNYFTSGAANRGQPDVFLPGTRTNAFQVTFGSGTFSWKLNNSTLATTSTSPRC
jgi:hypothetical protein